MIKGLYIDGNVYDVACGAERRARIESSDMSGYMLDGSYYNDPIGTYFDYVVTVAVPVGNETEYADMYEALSDPMPYHTFILPYNNTNATIKGRITKITDSFVKPEGAVNLWRGTSFMIISSEPQKGIT